MKSQGRRASQGGGDDELGDGFERSGKAKAKNDHLVWQCGGSAVEWPHNSSYKLRLF